MKKLIISITSFFIALILLVLQVGYGILRNSIDGKVSATSQTLVDESGIIEETSISPLAVTGDKLETSEFKKEDFIIEIKKIGLKKEVTPNVDPRDKKIYGPVIEESVAHGMFTKLPDETVDDGMGNVYLFAHRDGKYAFFARLGELENGDKISLYFLGKIYIYVVYDSFIVLPTDTYVYTSFAEEPTLTLQTCNNGVKERLIVKARLVEVFSL